jgi:hypothetical protein
MGSDFIMHLPNYIKIGSGIHRFATGAEMHRYTAGDFISLLLLLFQTKKSRPIKKQLIIAP